MRFNYFLALIPSDQLRENKMSVLTKLNIGISGACGRGASFKFACDALDGVRIHAGCDYIC